VQHFQGLAKSYNFDPTRVVPDLTPRPDVAMKRRATDAALNELPKASSANRGMKIRDTQTGEILQSDGMTWKAVK
jgi:hypothetical protein